MIELDEYGRAIKTRESAFGLKSTSLNLICLFTGVGLVRLAESGMEWVPSLVVRKELGYDLREVHLTCLVTCWQGMGSIFVCEERVRVRFT